MSPRIIKNEARSAIHAAEFEAAVREGDGVLGWQPFLKSVGGGVPTKKEAYRIATDALDFLLGDAIMEADSGTATCPFCKRDLFDLIGLKSHLQKQQCDIYEEVSEIGIPF